MLKNPSKYIDFNNDLNYLNLIYVNQSNLYLSYILIKISYVPWQICFF